VLLAHDIGVLWMTAMLGRNFEALEGYEQDQGEP
jgi:hypothetical protein